MVSKAFLLFIFTVCGINEFGMNMACMTSSSVGGRSTVKIAAGAIVSAGSILRGDITIGSGTIVHPTARILAEAGPIIIGKGNIIQASVTIANRLPHGGCDHSQPASQIVGNGNIFQPGCTCEALRVGDGNIFSPNAYVSRDTVVPNGSIIGA